MITKVKGGNICECENLVDGAPCGHQWVTKIMPTKCPKCNSRQWNGKKRTGRPPTILSVLNLPKPKRVREV